jgi:hypothetical protein
VRPSELLEKIEVRLGGDVLVQQCDLSLGGGAFRRRPEIR